MAQNNAQRTTERSGITHYAEAGVTGDFRDAVYAGVAALKGRDPRTGIEVEVFSASAQVGGENEAQVGMGRLGISGKHGSLTAEVLTARAHGGAHNDDGSVGANSGLGASIVALEGTLVAGSDSLTFGLSAGAPSFGLSVGLRDIDHNGTVEKCFRVTAGPFTAGFCQED